MGTWDSFLGVKRWGLKSDYLAFVVEVKNYILIQDSPLCFNTQNKMGFVRRNTTIAYNHHGYMFRSFYTIFRPISPSRRYNRCALYIMGSHTVYRVCVNNNNNNNNNNKQYTYNVHNFYNKITFIIDSKHLHNV